MNEKTVYKMPPRITFVVNPGLAERYQQTVPDGEKRRTMEYLVGQLLDLIDKHGADAVVSGVRMERVCLGMLPFGSLEP